MRYICEKTHYNKRLWTRGDLADFDEEPREDFWKSIGDAPPDLMNDSKEVLMEKPLKLAEIKSFMKENFGSSLPGKISKAKAIDKLIYARDHHIEPEVIPVVED